MPFESGFHLSATCPEEYHTSMPVSVLPLFVLLLPFVEIAGFIIVGKAIGVLQRWG